MERKKLPFFSFCLFINYLFISDSLCKQGFVFKQKQANRLRFACNF